MQAEKYDRTVKPVVGRDISYEPGHHHRVFESTYSAGYSGWDDDKAWSSQQWIADELMDDRTGRPVVTAQHTERLTVENDKMNSYTEAESECR